MSTNTIRWSKYILATLVVAAVAGIGIRNVVNARVPDAGVTSDVPTTQVRRGPLTISVNVSGVIKPKDQVVLKNEVEGYLSILYIIPEGTKVKKGDLLVQLDASRLENLLVDQEIEVVKADATKVAAEEQLEVTKNKAQSSIDKAELAYQFAQEDLKNFLEGEYPQDLKTINAEITLAMGTAKRTQDEYEGSKRLYEKSFITQTELQADEQSALKAKLDLELAENEKVLLTKYTYGRKLTELQSEVKQTRMALERTNRQASADILQAEARLKAATRIHERKVQYFDKMKDQYAKCKIYAPQDGVAIYATSGRGGDHGRGDMSSGPLEEGRMVFQRQELIHMPNTGSFICEAKVHESNLAQVWVGQPVRLSVDALKGKTYWGKITHLSPLPDQRSIFENPDLKLYEVEIEIMGEAGDLRTGMNCLGEIISAEYKDALYIPVQSIAKVGEKYLAYVVENGQVSPREITVGYDNYNVIHVLDGLEENETILLNPPEEG